MNNKDIIEEIEKICEKEFEYAIAELKREGITPFDQQYQLGKKHLAQDILSKISHMSCEELLNKHKKNE